MFEEMSLKDLATIYNSYAQRLGAKLVKRFADRATAMKKIAAAREECPEKLVMIINRECKKRGAAADRFKLYGDLETTGAYIDKCKAAGYKAADAKRDLMHDELKGFIKLV